MTWPSRAIPSGCGCSARSSAWPSSSSAAATARSGGSSVAARNGTVTLAADADPALDTTVPIWAARQNAELLARALDREVEIAP